MCAKLFEVSILTGSYQTGRFRGHTRQSCWNTFLKSINDTLDAFIHLGVSNLKRDTDFSSLESSVVALYCKNKISPGVKNLSQLNGIYLLKISLNHRKSYPRMEHCTKTLKVGKVSEKTSKGIIIRSAKVSPNDFP